MKVKDWLDSAKKKLETQKISTARLDTLILLEDAINRDRAWLLANPEHKIDDPTLKLLDKEIDQRLSHEPLAYIRGKCEFYGREFKVTPATLQPRPETETMLEMFLKISSAIKSVIDVGTGSGAIAISISLEKLDLKVYATEINQEALNIAEENAKELSATVSFYQGDLLEPLPPIAFQQPTAILANLPYVPDSFTINESAMQEPKIAIFGGKDGLDLYRQLFIQVSRLSKRPAYLFTESLPFQHTKLEEIAKLHNYHLTTTSDLVQLFASTPVTE